MTGKPEPSFSRGHSMAAYRVGIRLVLTLVLATPAFAAAQTSTPRDEGQSTAPLSVAAAETGNRTEPGSVSTGLARDRVPGFPELFSGLSHDFTRLASKDSLLIAGLGASGAFASHALDVRIAASGWGRGFARESLEPGRIVGGALVQSSAAFATYVIGRVADKPRLARVGAELSRAQIVAQVTTQAIKFGSKRTRPDGTMLSFPSGHTSASFATASVLHREFGWKAAVPAYTMAAWVAASRMQSKRHYLSDVIAGATVGILAGRAVTVGRGDARFSVAPMTVHGGIGISFVRVN